MTKREADPSELLAELAGGGKVAKGEALRLAERIKQAVCGEDLDQWDFDEIYELTLVIGKAKVRDATPALERLLDAQEPMTLCLVLDILCLQWKRAEDYIERIMTFAVGAVWDEELDVQEKAIEILGTYASDRISEEKGQPSSAVKRVVDVLWQQFASDEEDWVIRRAAYRALVVASGRQVNGKDQGRALFERLPRLKTLDRLAPELASQLDKDALEDVRRLLVRKSA